MMSMLQSVEPDLFVTKPIIFGDFIKVGAPREDRTYEELNNTDKLSQALQDVSYLSFTLAGPARCELSLIHSSRPCKM